jgi:hypothetical protein
VASILENGHTLTIYSYHPEELRASSLHTDIRDAREIIPESDPSCRYIQARKYALFANIFRLTAQISSIGVWVDLDCLFLKPLTLADEYLFGWASDVKLNNAVLRLPARSEMTADYHKGISAVPLRTPWSTPRRRIFRELEILAGRDMPSIKTRTNIGPRALTYYAEKHGKLARAQAKPVFYPVTSGNAPILTRADDKPARQALTEETVIVHAWQGKLKREGCLQVKPAASSFLGSYCKRYGI